MRRPPNEEAPHVRTISGHISPSAFKAEVASIVKNLGKRLEQLLEEHEACVLSTSHNGNHLAAGKMHVSSAFPSESDMETAFLPGTPEAPPPPPAVELAQMPVASMAKEMAFLPGCIEDSPLSPDVKAKGALGQNVGKMSFERCASADFNPEALAARTIWTEEHTDAQQEAVAKYEASVRFAAFVAARIQPGSRQSHASLERFRGIFSMGVSGKRTPRMVMNGSPSKPTLPKCEPCAILHPVGQTRTIWNLLSLILICQDALTVPLLVFGIGDSVAWQVLAWFCTLFWTADVFFSFRTGFFVGVKVEMRQKQIARHYAVTWLAFDIGIVVFEWFSRFFSSIAPPGVARTTRVLRAVRLLKLLRIAKMKGLLNEFSERLNSNTLALILNLFLLSTLLCVISHFVACGWYALGDNLSDGWTSYDLYAVERGTDQLGFEYWYVSSARWVISQINGRTDMDERRNMPERGFAVVAGIILSVVGRSVFVALITKSMLQLSELYKKKEERRRCVNDYLSLHPIPATMERSVKEAVQEYKDMDVERQRESTVLVLLPQQLQSDLLCEVRKPLLANHPLFGLIMQELKFAVAARHLCFDVIKQFHAAHQEIIFKSDDQCSRMLLMDAGNMFYGRPDDDVEDENMTCADFHENFRGAVAVTRVIPGMRLSEPALWATWTNKGFLITEDNCRMLEVDAMTLGLALQKHSDLFGLTVVYARYFVTFLARERHLSDIVSFDMRKVDRESIS